MRAIWGGCWGFGLIIGEKLRGYVQLRVEGSGRVLLMSRNRGDQGISQSEIGRYFHDLTSSTIQPLHEYH